MTMSGEIRKTQLQAIAKQVGVENWQNMDRRQLCVAINLATGYDSYFYRNHKAFRIKTVRHTVKC